PDAASGSGQAATRRERSVRSPSARAPAPARAQCPWDPRPIPRRSAHQQGRNTNGKGALRLPADVVEAYRASYVVDGHPKRNLLLAQESDFTLVDRYASIFGGMYHYYAWAQNGSWLLRLKFVMQNSLLHALAAKHRTAVKQILKRYKRQTETPSGLRTCLEIR